MAEIRPLRALRYNLEKAGPIENLTCPPYDIISPDQRRELLSRSGYNLIRLELPQEGKNPYQEAAHTLNLWRSEGVLQLDLEEGMYLYEEEFLSQVDRGDRRSVLGLVCRVRLEDFANGVVLPHEETLSKAKEDRFQLLSATRCNFSSIYSLYRDGPHPPAPLKPEKHLPAPVCVLRRPGDPPAVGGQRPSGHPGPAGGLCRAQAVHRRRPPPL